MKRLFTVAACAIGLLSGVMAQETQDRMSHLGEITKSKVLTGIKSETEVTSGIAAPDGAKRESLKRLPGISGNQGNAKKADASSGVETVKVTFRFPEIGEAADWYMPWGILYLYNEDGYDLELDVDPYDDDWNPITISEWECEVPVGTVDILSIFAHRNPDRFSWHDPWAYYIVENVELKDGVCIELRPQDSTICLEMLPTIPGGAKVELPKFSFDENWEYEILGEGNISDDSITQLILYKDMVVNKLFTNSGSEIVPGPQGMHDPYAEMSFYVNEVSDNYIFRDIHTMYAWPDESEGVYIAVTEARGSKEDVYTNGAYTLDEEEILPTVANREYPSGGITGEVVYPYGLVVWSYGSSSAQSTKSMNKSLWRIWNSGPADTHDSADLYYSIQREFEDSEFMVEDNGYVVVSNIVSTKVFPFAESGYTFCQFSNGYLNLLPTGYMPKSIFPGNESYMSLRDKTEIQAGGSAPLLTSYIYSGFDWNTSGMVDYPDLCYTGRMGETINSDIVFGNSSLIVADKQVATGIDAIQYWMATNHDVKGKYEMQVSTDNFEIDGIRGGNVATVTFDTSLEDGVPPTATFLQTRLNGDIVTQEFKNNDGAEIYLSATDLTICYSEPDEDGWQYSYCEFSTPAKVTAYATPTGVATEAYDEIEMTEHPDKFYAPGFGAFYTGSLESVRQVSPTGWFDLTLTVEDEAGNRQVQTLSPAFKIESLAAGVGRVGEDTEVYVRDGRIVMPEGSRVYTVDGREVSADAAVKGMYIVVAPKGSRKVVV